MTKFLTLTGVFFIIAIGAIAAICFFVFIGGKGAEFMDYIESKYGFRGSIIAFFAILAIVSSVAAAILTLTGV